MRRIWHPARRQSGIVVLKCDLDFFCHSSLDERKNIRWCNDRKLIVMRAVLSQHIHSELGFSIALEIVFKAVCVRGVACLSADRLAGRSNDCDDSCGALFAL